MRCRACGAPVRFVKLRTGRRMPVDVAVQPDVAPNIAAMLNARRELIDGYTITRATPLLPGYLALVPHFAVCPEAASFRQRKTPPPTLFDTPEETPR